MNEPLDIELPNLKVARKWHALTRGLCSNDKQTDFTRFIPVLNGSLLAAFLLSLKFLAQRPRGSCVFLFMHTAWKLKRAIGFSTHFWKGLLKHVSCIIYSRAKLDMHYPVWRVIHSSFLQAGTGVSVAFTLLQFVAIAHNCPHLAHHKTRVYCMFVHSLVMDGCRRVEGTANLQVCHVVGSCDFFGLLYNVLTVSVFVYFDPGRSCYLCGMAVCLH